MAEETAGRCMPGSRIACAPIQEFPGSKIPLASAEEHRGDCVREQTVGGKEIRALGGRKQREDCWGVE